MTGAEIRFAFVEFFRRRGHEVVPSASLVPDKDPTLLFTNAGMVQFKNVFLGTEKRASRRAVNSQKCLRLSGKHNDLEEVGRDTYHHTFFEMLGNWSFGDYYKREAIAWAWELFTKEWKLPKDKLYATVFETDDEAEECWRSETDIAPKHILRFGEKDNFWEMGEVGPCGPCSEIHIDRGSEACDMRQVPGHVCAVNAGCARFIELWNLVFIQYNRTPDGTLEPLAERHVDTGAGLERLAAVLQGVKSNYDTDLFQTIIERIEGIVTSVGNRKRYGESTDSDVSYRAIADHARAISFLIAEGLRPGNADREYVLRRLIRRAARHARRLGVGMIDYLLVTACEGVVQVMRATYQELIREKETITQVIWDEMLKFEATLVTGERFLEGFMHRAIPGAVLPGAAAFKLYDTYGFPLDMTQDILRDKGMTVDIAGFEACMEEQRQRGREARKTGVDLMIGGGAYTSRFVGDRIYESETRVAALIVDGTERDEARAGDQVQVIVPETPFYGESGGQVGDRGVIESEAGDLIEVVDAQKPRADLTVHIGTVVRGALHTGDRVRLRIDRTRRDAARLNHSATHILHAVLREHLGTQVHQAGSLVAPDRLRFDFNYHGPVAEPELRDIEEDVNARIRENALVRTEEMAYPDAIKMGALAFFGDKYGDRVRVVRTGEYSIELCGGTHAERTGDIGVFKLRAETGVAAGVRRVEALSGEGALRWLRGREQQLRAIGELLHGSEEDVAVRVGRLVAQQRELERQLKQLQSKLAGSQSDDLLRQARQVDGVTVLAAEVEGADDRGLRDLADRLREQIGSGVIVLGTTRGERALLLAAVTRDLTKRYHAGEIIKRIAPLVGGGGGGKPDLAQAGGKDPAKLREALEAVYQIVS
ncbi:MAG: alanine--tRNA ligase [Candidatus Binatia bacterium]